MQWSLAFVVLLGGDGDARAVHETGAVFAKMASCVIAGMRLHEQHDQEIEKIKAALDLREDYFDKYRSMVRLGLAVEEAHRAALAETIDGATAKRWFADARATVDGDSLDGPTLSKLADGIATAGIDRQTMVLDMPTAEMVQGVMLRIPEVAALDWPRLDEVRREISEQLEMMRYSGIPDRLDTAMTRTPSPVCLPTNAPATQ